MRRHANINKVLLYTTHSTHFNAQSKPCNPLWQKCSSVLEEIQVFSNVRIIFFVSQSDLGALFSFIDKFSSRIYEDFLHMCTYLGEAHSKPAGILSHAVGGHASNTHAILWPFYPSPSSFQNDIKSCAIVSLPSQISILMSRYSKILWYCGVIDIAIFWI